MKPVLKAVFDLRQPWFWGGLFCAYALWASLTPGYLSGWVNLFWFVCLFLSMLAMVVRLCDRPFDSGWKLLFHWGVIGFLFASLFWGPDNRRHDGFLEDTIEQIETRAPNALILPEYKALLVACNPGRPLPSKAEMDGHRPIPEHDEMFFRLLDLDGQAALAALRTEQLADGYVSNDEFQAFKYEVLSLSPDALKGVVAKHGQVAQWLALFNPSETDSE